MFLVVLISFLILPTIRHLYSGWKHRRDGILNGFDDDAKAAYFKAFQPSSPSDEPPSSRFKRYYNERFGRRHFILPLILLFFIAGILLLWSGFSIGTWLSSGNLDAFAPHRLSLFSVVAISGAYLYCISDQIRRWYTLDLSPADLYWLSFRFVAAIPLGWALRYFVAPNLAIPACFLIAAFPTNTLLAMMRRLLSQTLKVSDVPMGGDTQVKILPGIDIANAERFASENITTIAQLAYSDPVELTMRTNFDYSYIVDCLSQALLFIYVGKDYLDRLSLHGIRGSYEMRVICIDLEDEDEKRAGAAKEKLRVVAQEIGYPSAEALEKVALESGHDPCTIFIYESWMSPNKLNEV
jgi:hypothetical protein